MGEDVVITEETETKQIIETVKEGGKKPNNDNNNNKNNNNNSKNNNVKLRGKSHLSLPPFFMDDG